jgi:hypothetical protein
MDAQLKAKWVEALRSGEYEQARGHLNDHKHNTFCCLGVLADIQDGIEWRNLGCPYIDEDCVANHGLLLPPASGGLISELQQILAEKNDEGCSFAQIADYIEENL